MMDLPVRLFPPALLGGLAVYSSVTVLWLQPIVEKRLAARHFIPRCEAQLQYAENTAPVPDNPKRRGLETMLRILKKTPLGEIPEVGETLEEVKELSEAMRPSRLRISHIDRSNICGCAIDKALGDLGMRMTLHVASLRTHTPRALAAIDQNVLAIAGQGQCGKLPWK